MAEQKENKTAKVSGKKNIGNDKKRLLTVLEIMKRTDDEHPLTKNQILDKVAEKGVEVNNLKTIAADLAALKELGYDIVTDYVGNYMAGGQLFENYELKILADHIANARYLTTQHSQELIDRIKKLASESGEEMITATTLMDPKLKSSDGKMKYKLDFNFKVSRMEKVEETEEPARKIGEIKILSDGLGFADIQNYRRVMKNMWSGAKGQDVILKVQPYLADSKLVLSADRVREDEDGSLTVFTKAILNTGFYQALARYGEGVEIVRPEEARKGFVEYLKRILDIYEEENRI